MVGKHQKDLNDVRFIVEDVLRFATMSFQDFKRHLDEHPEDKLHDISMPNGSILPISREAARCLDYLTLRQWEITPDKHSIDSSTIEHAIRVELVEMFVIKRRPIERKWIDRMLTHAVKEAKKDHEAITHYLPCVIMTEGHPSYFRIGPVNFIANTKFFADYQLQIEEDIKVAEARSKEKLKSLVFEGECISNQKQDEEEPGQTVLNWIYEYYKGFVWIAEVAVPAGDKKVSREQAEMTVQAALDILKLFYGYAGGKHFRLAHHRSLPDKTAHLTRGPSGAFEWSIGSHSEGAFVKEDWYDSRTPRTDRVLRAAGNMIEGYLKPEVNSGYRGRWLDALYWYGQAVSEHLPAAQIVKYVAALERLTVTEKTIAKEVTDVVTRRTALLSVCTNDSAELTEACEKARELYRWRSDLMHGRKSPFSKKLLYVMRLADDITRNALFGALGMYMNFSKKEKNMPQDLEQRFVELERQLPKGCSQSKTANTKGEEKGTG